MVSAQACTRGAELGRVEDPCPVISRDFATGLADSPQLRFPASSRPHGSALRCCSQMMAKSTALAFVAAACAFGGADAFGAGSAAMPLKTSSFTVAAAARPVQVSAVRHMLVCSRAPHTAVFAELMLLCSRHAPLDRRQPAERQERWT